MKRSLAIALSMILVLTGCSNGTDLDSLKESHQRELEVLQSEIDNTKTINEAVERQLSVMKEALLEMEKENDVLADENAHLMSQIEGLTSAMEEDAVDAMSPTPFVVLLAETVAQLIRDQDFTTLSTHVHPTDGVRFSPYPYINLGTDKVMTVAEVSLFGTDPTVYYWGDQDGSGDPINKTPMDYYSDYVYDEDYATPEMMSWNSPIGSGNMINNITSVYPAADYVEFHFTGFNPDYEGLDWSSMTLVFEQVGPTWYLVGIIHGQWTI